MTKKSSKILLLIDMDGHDMDSLVVRDKRSHIKVLEILPGDTIEKFKSELKKEKEHGDGIS